MTGPTWLATIFGAVVLVVAVYTAGRLVVAWRTGRATDYEVDGSHVFMGVAMAGMLIPGLGIVQAGASTVVWVIVFVLISAWLAITLVRELRHTERASGFMGHHLPHLVMSLAMVYMLLTLSGGDAVHAGGMSGNLGATGIGGAGLHGGTSVAGLGGSALGGSGMSVGAMGGAGMSGSALVALPTLDLLFALFMVGYAVLVIDRLPLIAVIGTGDLRVPGRRRSATDAVVPLAPRLGAVSYVAMAITMGYMLTMMFV
jgi:hypothetical protein